MDQSAVKRLVERDLETLMRAFGVPHWSIRVCYGPIDGADDGCMAQGHCHRLIDYESATITLDPANLDDEDEVLKTLRHELMHVVLSPFDLLRSWMLTGPKDADYERALTIANHATEIGVKNLSRMWVCVKEYHEKRLKAEGWTPPKTASPKAKPKRR